MTESQVVLPPLTSLEGSLLWVVLACAVIALLYGWYLSRKVLKVDPGSKEMQEVSKAIQEGADAYLGRQFRTMIFFVIIITVGLFFMYLPIYRGKPLLAVGIAVAFLMGVFASYGAGFVGMSLAVRGNVRVANAALSSFKKALEIAFQAGTVSGMFTIGLGLLGATIIFLIFKQDAMKVLVGFGFGGCLAALFMRMGGGIFTKAADVGADLVGKVEKGIPEDDPRNAATIADNVGDNVGDCAGMAADVFESYEVTLVAAIILGAAVLLDKSLIAAYGGAFFALKLIIYPLLVRAIGVFASMFGTWSVRGKEDMKDPMKPISLGFWISALAAMVGVFIVNWFFIKTPQGIPDLRFFVATALGVVLALITLWVTNYYTHIDKPPVNETAHSTKTGAATMILTGMAQGLQSSVWAILAIVLTILGSFLIFSSDLHIFGYVFKGSITLAMYGIALSGLGLLTTTGYILAMDTYGPITDNASGIFEMSGALKEGEEDTKAGQIVAKLDAIGNTTKALTKGLAIATAVIAAIALFSSFIGEAGLLKTGIQVNIPSVFIGLLIGGAVPFLFSSFAINAVGRAAFGVVEEVRRQFREKPGIMEFKEKPDYGKCVDISTKAAQKELISPGILAIFTPILVGFALGAPALGAYLAGAILTGQLMAVYMANTGAIYDNAKKKIEEGLFGGKGTEFHKAGVVGDTVGDPLKDTAGPALNPLIKVMNLVAILIAPVVISNIAVWIKVIIVIVGLILLGIAVAFSNRGSIVEKAVEEAGSATESAG